MTRRLGWALGLFLCVLPGQGCGSAESPRTSAESPSLQRAAAEEALQDAVRLRSQWTESAGRQAIVEATRAAGIYDSLGDQEAQIRAQQLLADLHYRLVEHQQALQELEAASRLSRTRGLAKLQAEVEAFRGLLLAESGGSHSQQEAFDSCREAKQVSQSADYPEGEAAANRCLGEIEYWFGGREKAIAYYLQSLEIWRRLPPQNGRAETLLHLGQVYSDMRRIEEAERAFREALGIWEGDEDPRGRVLAQVGLGQLAARTGEHQKALELLTKALQPIESSGDHLWQTAVSNLLGGVYIELGEPATALKYFQQALAGFEAIGLPKPLAETHWEVGRAYQALGDDEKALQHYQSTLKIIEATGDPRVLAYTHQRIASLLEGLGRLEESEESYRRALAAQPAGEDPGGRAETLNGLGRVRRAKGDLPEAQRLHQEALLLSRKADDGFAESPSLYYLALVEKERRNFESALSQAESAIQRAESLRFNVDDLRLRASYFATVQAYYRLAIDMTMQLDAQHAERGWAAKALHFSERARARSLLESLVEKEIDSGNRPPVQPLSLAEIQRELDDRTALLEYSLGSEKSYLWVITRNQMAASEIPAEPEIGTAVRNLYDALTARDRTTSGREIQEADRLSEEILSRLGEALFPSAAAQIAGKRLVIVPDGVLYYLPFAALLRSGQAGAEAAGGAEARPLVLDHDLVTLPSASALSILRERGKRSRQAGRSIAILADPVFEADDPRLGQPAERAAQESGKPSDLLRALRDFRPDQRVPRLISSGYEAETIRGLAPAGKCLLASGFEANRSLVASGRLKNFSIIHFATHGFLNAENPELSGLILSLVDEKGQPRDGFLRLNDVYSLDLPVDLVVLSACQTGLGREVRGEGLIGLVRAFQYAGAQNVIASLWKVDDAATELLMREFYAALFEELLAPDAALRKAQTAMWKSKRWKAPFFWAAFVLQGDLRAPGA